VGDTHKNHYDETHFELIVKKPPKAVAWAKKQPQSAIVALVNNYSDTPMF
jgi:hypothetical protein